MLRVDLENDGVPFESPSNKAIMATAQYFGADSKSRGFDQQTANSLNEKGITTICFWAGQWVLWGPHTAAYTYNGAWDARAIFDAISVCLCTSRTASSWIMERRSTPP